MGSRVASDRRVALWLGLCAALFYLPFTTGFFRGSDEVGVFQTTRALFETADLAVPEIVHTYRGRDGRNYSVFAVGQPVLALPFYGFGRLMGSLFPPSWSAALAGPEVTEGEIRFGGSVEIFAVGLYAPCAGGLLVALFFLFQRRLGVSRRSALAASLMLGASTYAAALSTFFLRHVTEALAIVGSLYALYGFKKTGDRRLLALGSLLASGVLLIRVPAAVGGPALAGYALWTLAERRRAGREDSLAAIGAALAVPAAAVAAIHLGVNYWRWGTWLASPMLAQQAYFGTPLAVGVSGLLLSPGTSLFLYSPPLLLIPATLAAFWRSHRAECVALLAICLSFLVLGAKFELWHGLWSAPGPRMIFVATPLLMLPLGGWLDAVATRGGRVVALGLAVAGVGVQLMLLWASWPGVTEAMGYRDLDADRSFLFTPSLSPIVGYVRVFFDGHSDAWLWRMLHSTPARGGAALGIGMAWAVAFGASLAALRRAVR